MSIYLSVTRAQRAAARAILRRDAAAGRASRSAVVKIATATHRTDADLERPHPDNHESVKP